jgi:predicted dehydrogenase
MKHASPVRFGILGTAHIATKVGRAIHEAEGAEIAAIASRDRARAAAWAAEHTRPSAGEPRPTAFLSPEHPPLAVGSYEELLADPSIDAVYLPLPPSLHAEWTIKAAECGKHVLCEKPLALDLAEARAMADACRAHNVQLMDGVMWVHHERTRGMERVLQSGALGRLRRVTSAFSFDARDFRPDNIRFQRELGGGALADLGWYCVRATLWALGALPERVFAAARYRNEVDHNFSATLWFADDRMASFDCGFDTAMRKWLEVAGSDGSLVCDDFVLPWDPLQARFWVHGSHGKASQETFPGCIQEVRMVEQFCRAIRSGTLETHWVDEALATQAVCDALDRSARSGEPVALPPLTADRQ